MNVESIFSDNFPLFSIIFYAGMIAAEILLSQLKLVKASYDWRDTLANFAATLGSFIISLGMAGIVFAGLSVAYRFRAFTISPVSPLAWVAIFFLDDFCYYWFHRISHESRFWWASHSNHHSSQHYNLSTAVRQAWTGEITGTWLIWIPLALLGFPPQMILFQQGLNLFYQFWIHTEVIRRMPPWFEFIFNTPSHHRVHHASNPSYLDRNYGGVLILWDRLFRTFSAERDDEPVRYGLVHNINTHNPFKIAFAEWLAIRRDLGTATSGREILGILFGPPGWKQGETSDHIRAAWLAAQSTGDAE